MNDPYSSEVTPKQDPDIDKWLDSIQGQEWLNLHFHRVRDWNIWLKLKDDEIEWTQSMDWSWQPRTVVVSSYAGDLTMYVDGSDDFRNHP